MVFTFKLIYSDNTIEYSKSTLLEFGREFKRLSQIHNHKLKFKILELS